VHFSSILAAEAYRERVRERERERERERKEEGKKRRGGESEREGR
jgi:hypothetical protein